MSLYRGSQATGANSAAADTIHHVLASATTRCGITEFIIGSEDTPAEYMGKYRVVRTTSIGTTPAGSTSVVKVNSFSPTAGCTYGGGGYGTEPTTGDVLMDFAAHQKSTFRWVAHPGRELYNTPTANCGVGLVVVAMSTVFKINSGIEWLE